MLQDTVLCAITVCPNGCVRLVFGVAVIHLTPMAFRQFVEAATGTLSRLEESSRQGFPGSEGGCVH